MENLKYAVEGILFAAGEAVKTAKLAVVLEKSVEEIDAAAMELKADYDRDKRGFAIIEISEGYQICSRPDYYKYIREILGEQRNQPLSNAAMEALAIIAYKQPVTRGMIEKVRGVNSDGCVSRLYERGLIEEAGRLDAPGRPVLYKTTDTFLRCFGLKTPQDLPPINFQMTIPELMETGEQLSIVEETAPATEDNGQAPEMIPETESQEE
ncbi:MAG: SMC-Scp complex subunit ScpB [Clostridia bacterium]|nr:SMC-Scp complex subunit ScpB [Clostridia bacterium]